MRALLTGASSFSGYWFAAKLQAAGFTVVAPLRGTACGLHRRARRACTKAWRSRGDSRRLSVRQRGVSRSHCDRRSSMCSAIMRRGLVIIAASTSISRRLLPRIPTTSAPFSSECRAGGSRPSIFTGSVFEANEGAGNEPMRAFSPYGLSKGLTAQVVRHWCTHYNVPFGKFLIANPFGPLEEPRFCAYLIKTWQAGQVAEVRTPRYLRDNIHVDLLALAYANFVKRMVETRRSDRFGPMGYVETQGAFSERYAQAMRPRLGLDCRRKASGTDGFFRAACAHQYASDRYGCARLVRNQSLGRHR